MAQKIRMKRQLAFAAAKEQTTKFIIRPRVEKGCYICKRSCNLTDHVNEEKLLAWTYEKQARIDDETGKEILQGRVDKYCDKARCLLMFAFFLA